VRPKKPAGKAPGSGSIREATQRIIFRNFSWDANHLASQVLVSWTTAKLAASCSAMRNSSEQRRNQAAIFSANELANTCHGIAPNLARYNSSIQAIRKMPSSERRHTLHGRVTNETERALLAAAESVNQTHRE
jgi:hypothetical protein